LKLISPVLAEHLLVQEQQRRQGLPMRGHGHLPIGRQPGKNGLDLGLPHLARVAHGVKAHDRAHPKGGLSLGGVR